VATAVRDAFERDTKKRQGVIGSWFVAHRNRFIDALRYGPIEDARDQGFS